MNKSRKRFGLIAVIGVLLLALIAGSCTPAKPVEEKVIKIGNRVGLTGPGASTAGPVGYGNFDYIKYINEKGGINGIKIKMLWEDTAGKVPAGITAHKRLMRSGALMEMDLFTSVAEASVPIHLKDEMLLFHQAAMTQLLVTERPRWVFGGFSGYESEVVAFMKWVKANWTEARPPRIGLLIPDWGAGWAALEGAKQAPALGIEFVGHEFSPALGVIDTSVEQLRLAGKNPDWIYSNHFGASLVVIIKDSTRLELQKKGINFVEGWGMLDEIILSIVGADGEGWHTLRWHPTLEEADLPAMRAALEVVKQQRGWEPERAAGVYLVGWLFTAVVVEGLRVAMETAGYENLTPRVVRDAFASIKNFDTGMVPPITMSDDRPYALAQTRPCQVRQGKVVPVSDWIDVPCVIELD